MKANLDKRLAELESVNTDWSSKLNVIDYDGILDDYSKKEWTEVHRDQFVTVVQHTETNEVRGYYFDRRSDDQIISEGGNLEYL